MPIDIGPIDQKTFNTLAAYSRSPVLAYVAEEIAWYANGDNSVIGVVLRDTVDNEYASVVLGKDEVGKYRAFDNESSFPDEKEATEWLVNTMKWHTGIGTKVFPQGDAGKTLDLFRPIVPIEKQHPYFVRLNRDAAYTPAKAVINQMMPHFRDVDGNFVEQFQTTGFDSRLWELCLFGYFTEETLFIDRTHSSPDFLLTRAGFSVGVEAVIVGRKENNPPRYLRTEPVLPRPDAVQANANEIPIRYGSPLFSKLNKKYWILEHLKGKPIVLAIADFHDDFSMAWTSSGLITYLYGYRHKFHYDSGNLVITPERVETHRLGTKEIPSGFFKQPEAENISGVLFSQSGTISKFNRLGRQAGFGDKSIRMIRQGVCHDHDPNASVPRHFQYEVDENSEETWGEGFSLFHNPNAQYPVPDEFLPSIAHHHFVDGQIVSSLPDFHPYGSLTVNIHIRG